MRLVLLVAFAVVAAPVVGQTAPVWRFDTDGDLEGFTPGNFESTEVAGGRLRGTARFDCQLLSPPVKLDAAVYRFLEFRLASSVTGGGELFFAHEGEGMSEQRMARHYVHASAEPRVYRVDLSQVLAWTGVITRFRLDLVNLAGAELALDYVRFSDRDWGKAPNPGFEDDFDGDRRPDGWRIAAARWEWTGEHAIEGDRALMIATGQLKQAGLTARVPLDELGLFGLEAAITHSEGAPPKAVTASFRYFDVFGWPLPDAPAVLTAGKLDTEGRIRLAGEFTPPPLAASADLTLTVTGAGAAIWWDGIQVAHLRDLIPAGDQPLETWRAHWIWAAATAGQDHCAAYLRRELTLPADQLTAATVQVTADDQYELYVNGRKVQEVADPDGWRTPETIDLKAYLTPGRNVLAVLAKDVASAEGFLLEGCLRWATGSLDLFSDGSWRGAGEAPEGWTAPDFDDRGWPPAKVIGQAGCPPWGNLPYTYPGVRERLAVKRAELPATITAGATLKVSAVIDKLPASAATAPLRCALVRDEEVVIGRVVGVAEGTAPVAGGVRLGPVELPLARFLPAGQYTVRLGFPHTEYAAGKGIDLGTVTVKAAGPEPPTRVEVRPHGGLPTLFLNGVPNSFMHYLENVNSRVRLGNMAAAGVHLYELVSDDLGWLGPDRYDYSAWDRKALECLAYDPQARIIPTFDVSGLRHRFWLQEHPDQWARTESGDVKVGIYNASGKIISLASLPWREAAGEAVRRFVEHCQASPYAGRVIGYHPCSGVSWEWQHWGSVGEFEPTDYSEPMQAAFRDWAKRRYGGDLDKLRAAWRRPELTFETIRIPSVKERDGADHLLFRDPRTYGYVIDFYRFFQDVMVDGIEHYFRIIKQASGGRALCGTYYGYTVTMLGGARRAGDSGHFALARLLDSDLCDFLMSPFDYSSRAVGEPYTAMTAVGSVTAHGKLWVLQADLRTHLVTDPGQRRHGSPPGLDGTRSQLERAFANATAKGSATQWYDFSNGWIAGDARQGQIISRLRQAGEQWATWPDRGPDPDGVAVVVDEQTPACFLGHDQPVNYWLVYRQKAIFERLGAPWNLYLLDDVTSGRLPKFRCYVFLNCFHMTDAQRDYLRRELQGGGRTLVWMYAPGYASDTDLDVRHLDELTGMSFVEQTEAGAWRTDFDARHPLLAGVAADRVEQSNLTFGPVFHPRPEGLSVAGTWPGTTDPGLAVRKLDGWTSVWSAGPLLSPEILKNVCRLAGVHLTVDGVEPSWVTRNLVGLHTAVARTEHLRFEQPTTVTDLLTGEVLAKSVRELDVPVPGPGTRILRTTR